MSSETSSPAADLAFMRSLVEGGGVPAAFGEGYLAAGLIYGGQVVLQGAEGVIWPHAPSLVTLALGVAPTLLFCLALVWIIRRHPGPATGGYASRAMGALFGCIGLANFVLMAVIGIEAARAKSFEVWLIYPCVVFVMQGACWLAAAAVRRRRWHALVALGWFATAVLMALALTNMAAFTMIAGIGLIGFMAVPGAIMLRLARR